METLKSKIIKEFNRDSNQTIKEIAEKFNTSKPVVSISLTEYFKKKLHNKRKVDYL